MATAVWHRPRPVLVAVAILDSTRLLLYMVKARRRMHVRTSVPWPSDKRDLQLVQHGERPHVLVWPGLSRDVGETSTDYLIETARVTRSFDETSEQVNSLYGPQTRHAANEECTRRCTYVCIYIPSFSYIHTYTTSLALHFT